MASSPALKPTQAPVRNYYLALAQLANVGASHESAVREAFHALIEHAEPKDWHLVREYSVSRKGAAALRLDAVLLDSYRIPHGVIEAKDDADNLADEMRAKLKLGYPAKNTLFWQPRRAILVQDGKVALDYFLDTKPEQLCEVVARFLAYTEPVIADWERATEEFRERVAELGRSVREVIQRARGTVGSLPNKKFVAAFNDFAALCRSAINPSLADSAIEEMLIQHLLTARLFGSVFDNPEFTRRNVVAVEIEKVIDALASGHFSRAEFLKKLDRFYLAIESAAKLIEDFSEKQKFLNTVYEKFFQGFAVKVADTMGIVYTPPSIVRFMIASIRELLQREFGKELGDTGVHFLDPFTGTGNFVVHLMRELPTPALKKKYFTELWANEIMLLPYYIAAQNIEHELFARTGTYEPFPGLCLVDTFELAEPHDQVEMEFLSAKNTERVNAQKKAPIRVILGNPPYNANQQDENDNNKNRKYPRLDQRIKNTYAADSKATLLNKLSDPYIKALAWASDRIGDEGIVAYVTNSGYLDGIATDGVRHHLARDFDAIYLVDLGGNVRKNPKLSGTTHNVFGIQVGVSIALFVRHKQKELKKRKAVIRYVAVGEDWRKERKWKWLEEKQSVEGVKWRMLKPDERHTWLHDEESAGFGKLLPMGSKETKAIDSLDAHAIFRTYSLGVSTNRDSVVYDFDRERLATRVEQFADDYNSEVSRWQRKKPSTIELDGFLKTERIKWSRNLKSELKREKFFEFDKTKIRQVLYRPFTRRFLYLDDVAVDEPARSRVFSPESIEHAPAISLSDIGHRAQFAAMMIDGVYDLHLCASSDAFQSFPLYTYDADGGHRRDNVTDWALAQFQTRYPGVKLTKRDIFHFIYAVLHHPAYREKYAANLRRELPRIPFAPDFAAFAKAGEKLAALHTGYESQKECKLKRVETPGVKPDWRVERMKLSKDKTALIYNDWLMLEGIPAAAHGYRLGNRSALDWVIDQYRVERDATGEITSDPNRADDEEYIIRLIGQVITVSVETMKVVAALPALDPAANATERGTAPVYTQADLDAAHIYAKEEPATDANWSPDTDGVPARDSDWRGAGSARKPAGSEPIPES
ncbi:MAG: type ISP restriction/modification enzyme [Opitutaceae bacterium]|nr:type ISP restriction/modification enzyme [Opitutaceae bacterium]